MTWGAVIAGAGAVIGGVVSSKGSKSAAKKGSKGQDKAIEEQRRQFDLSLDLIRPSIEAGDTSREALLSLLGLGGDPSSAIDQIRQTPGFQFQTEQGTRALNASRSAGGTSGGALLKDFARFNQGLASNFYQDYANRLANLAGTGQQAATTAGNQAIVTGRGIGQNLENIGLLRGSGVLGSNQALATGINQLGTILGGINFGGTQGSGQGTLVPSNQGTFRFN